MQHRSRAFGALILAACLPVLSGAEAPGGDVTLTVGGLRSARGQVMACLTSRRDAFPNCRKDAAAHKLVVPAAGTVTLSFGHVAPGRYAVSFLHDENGNGKADMALIIPKEGFGFSRDAAVSFGPPRFEAAAFDVAATDIHQTVRMRYMM